MYRSQALPAHCSCCPLHRTPFSKLCAHAHSLSHSETTNCCIGSENATGACNFSEYEFNSSSYIACSGTANASGRPEGAIDKYVGKTLLSTISCKVGFSAFCFTIELHVHDVQALPAYRPSHPCLDSLHKKFIQSF